MFTPKDSQTGAYVGKQDRSMFTRKPKRVAKAATPQQSSAAAKRRFTPTHKKVSK